MFDFYRVWCACFERDQPTLVNAYWDFYLSPGDKILSGEEYRWGGGEDGHDFHYRYFPGLESVRLNRRDAFVGEYYRETFGK